MHSAILSKWKLLPVAALVAVGLIVTAAEPSAPVAPNPRAAAIAFAVRQAPPDKPARPGVLLVSRENGAFRVVNPDGKKVEELDAPDGT